MSGNHSTFSPVSRSGIGEIPKERKFQRRGVEEYYKVIFIVGVKKEYSEFF